MSGGGERLRIAVLNRVFASVGGGAERYSMALVEQLAQRHEIHVFAQQIEHRWPAVTYHRVSAPLARSRWLNQLWYASATWWATRRGFDVVHSHENVWHGQVQTVHVLPVKAKLFHDRSGWRRLLRGLQVLTSPRLLAYLWLEQLRFRVHDGRCIVIASDSLRGPMAQAYPATAAALQVVTPGVTLVGGPATPAQQLAARRRLGLPQGGWGILLVGNDYRKKGLQTLIKALAQLPDNAWLAVVGNGSQIAEFALQAKAAGVVQRVFFLGPLRDVSDAYAAADCLAHPTLEDTFAMVVLEAMAHGLPVLASGPRYCGISSLLTNESNALILAEPLDAGALARALRRVLEEPQLRHTLSAAALTFAGQYQWSVIARQQEAIYFSVRAQQKRPPESNFR